MKLNSHLILCRFQWKIYFYSVICSSKVSTHFSILDIISCFRCVSFSFFFFSFRLPLFGAADSMNECWQFINIKFSSAMLFVFDELVFPLYFLFSILFCFTSILIFAFDSLCAYTLFIGYMMCFRWVKVYPCE